MIKRVSRSHTSTYACDGCKIHLLHNAGASARVVFASNEVLVHRVNMELVRGQGPISDIGTFGFIIRLSNIIFIKTRQNGAEPPDFSH